MCFCSFCSFCTGPNILQYILLYNWITIHVSVQQSQRKTSSLLQQCRLSKLVFLLIRPTDRPTDRFPLRLITTQVRLIRACYANIPSFSSSKEQSLTFVHLHGKINLREPRTTEALKG